MIRYFVAWGASQKFSKEARVLAALGFCNWPVEVGVILPIVVGGSGLG